MSHRPYITTTIISRPKEPALMRAIVSALRQVDVENEVVVVLDGRCPDNRRQIAQLRDPRVRVFEHAQCLGRGAARAHALEEARGEWICTVDADDWIFPQKLIMQSQYLAQHPEVELVATGLYVTDRIGDLNGVRGDVLYGYGVAGRPLPALHTPTMMMRTAAAREVSYNPACRAGEDREFLWRFLPGRTWASMDEPTYVYDEYASHSLSRCLSSYGRRMRMDARLGSPTDRIRNLALNGGKALVATGAFALGQGDWLVARRSSPTETHDQDRYQKEKKDLQEALASFGISM